MGHMPGGYKKFCSIIRISFRILPGKREKILKVRGNNKYNFYKDKLEILEIEAPDKDCLKEYKGQIHYKDPLSLI
jgi:hypothetical protein